MCVTQGLPVHLHNSPFVSFLIILVSYCTVVWYVHVLCGLCCCPSAALKRFEPKRDGMLKKLSLLLLLL